MMIVVYKWFSNFNNLACITNATKHIPKVECAIIMVINPLPAGHPINISKEIKKSSKDNPITTSGITIGAIDKKESMFLPQNLFIFVKEKARRNPKKRLKVAEILAIKIDLINPLINFWSVNISKYHLNEKPAHTKLSLHEMKL